MFSGGNEKARSFVWGLADVMRWIAMLRGLVDKCSVDDGGTTAITSQNPVSSAVRPQDNNNIIHNNTQQQQSLAPGMGFCVVCVCYINI